MRSVKQTKIIATLGPASTKASVLKNMIKSGVDVIRLNASHFSDTKEIEAQIKFVRDISKELSIHVGIFLDLQGPKIRVGDFKNGKELLKDGALFSFYAEDCDGTQEGCSLSYPELIKDLRKGDFVYVDDGKIRLQVIQKKRNQVICKVKQGGMISNKKGVNLPMTETTLSVLTAKDKKNLKVAVEYQLEYVALSFVSRASDITQLRRLMSRWGGSNMGIIAKIERSSAVQHINEILQVSDMIMVARGDLGVEIGVEKVPEVQKMIIRESMKYIKPVIVATQMLESMISSKVATRAEVSDVANAIYDGCDAVMLSGETAMGIDPVNVIRTTVDICEATDKHRSYLKKIKYSHVKKVFEHQTMATTFCKAADQIADENNADAHLAFTSSGSTARIASKLNPSIPIVSLTDDMTVLRRLMFYRGVTPLFMTVSFDKVKSWGRMISVAVDSAKKAKIFKKGYKVVVTAGIPIGIPGGTNSIRMIDVD